MLLTLLLSLALTSPTHAADRPFKCEADQANYHFEAVGTVGANGLTGEVTGNVFKDGKFFTSAFTLTIPLEGLVDTSAEKARLQNEIKRVRTDVEFSLKRLENPAFVERAKPELVEKERATLTANKEKLAVLEEALKKLG
jgi:valyl-tRNA synthetase